LPGGNSLSLASTVASAYAARMSQRSRQHAWSIAQAAIAAADPGQAVANAFGDPRGPVARLLDTCANILVVGAGKAGGPMALAAEQALAERGRGCTGVVNVPVGSAYPTRSIRLHPARPPGTNEPTAEGVDGAEQMLDLLGQASPQDGCLCLLSGGGSALLPAPAPGLTLADKQATTRLLHACGASIREINAVRKHLSRIKGGRLAASFRGWMLVSLIVSDVVGDPLDVIASGPTAPDPTTYADAVAILQRYGLWSQVSEAVRAALTNPPLPETPKTLPDSVVNQIICSNTQSLAAAQRQAAALGYSVLNLGGFIEGDTAALATVIAGLVRSIRAHAVPLAPPACLLLGGETTVRLPADHGRGGRNQQFVLELLCQLGPDGMDRVTVLSVGTDGEDGPTDAAGTLADRDVLADPATVAAAEAARRRCDAYPFFDQAGTLIRTGLTGTNVMDVRLVLIE
jgi:glycerate 2-kinase